MAAVIALVITLLLSGPVIAQETSLIDILQAKGVLSQEEAQKLRSTGAAKGGYDQQALVNLLKAKGVLDEQDLAQLPAPVVSATAPPAAPPPASAPAPELAERLARLEQEANKKAPFVAGYEDGFFVRSADGNFSLRIGGRVSLHTLYQQEDTSQNDSFFMD